MPSLIILFLNSALAHASMVNAAIQSPISCGGFLLRREVSFLGGALLHSPRRPLAALVGGAKVSSKLKVLHRLLAVVDRLLIGGAMV